MTREQLDALTRKYLERTLEESEERLALEWDETGLEVHQDALIEEVRRISSKLSRADYGDFLGEARMLLPDADESLSRRLARRLMEVRLEALEAEIRTINGEPLRLHSMGRSVTTLQTLPAAKTEAAKATSPPLSVVVAQHRESKQAVRAWSARSAEHYSEIYATVIELLGDVPIASVTKEDIRRLGLSLTNYPKNAKKVFPGLSAPDALARAEENPAVARLSPRSVNIYQQAVRSLFRWAHEHDLIPSNPASVLVDVKVKGTALDERLPFSDEDLVRYFGVLQAERRIEPCLFWIPAIMAYTGCRLGEVAQLRKTDLREELGVWVADINADHNDKRLKNEYSRRVIPLHPRLIDLGVLELRPEGPDGFLWPEEMRTPRRPGQSPIDRLQRKLAVRLARAGVDHPRKTAAHSFRHTVSSRLKAASVPDYQIAEILGHKNPSMSTGRYGSRTDVRKLLAVIRLLSLPV